MKRLEDVSTSVRQRMEEVIQLEHQVRAKEARILNIVQQIQDAQGSTAGKVELLLDQLSAKLENDQNSKPNE